MTENTYRESTPQEYIYKLFEETAGDRLTINTFPLFDQPYATTYRMGWTKKDADEAVARYDALTAALCVIGKTDKADCREGLLSPEELEVYNTYVRPFPDFEVDLEEVGTLYFRSETETVEEDEYELLERHHEWFVENSRKRLPVTNRCPSYLINRAQRFERLASINAPDCVLQQEGRCLAEELVLYYYSVKKLAFDLLRFIAAQMTTYEKALSEIKKGKKRTHWMWYIFPQLRGLGVSEMAKTYGIIDLDEAEAYLNDEVLGARLREISAELLKLPENNAVKIFGDIDAVKLRSSMTLFAIVSEEDSVFHKVLLKFFDGKQDPSTLALVEE